MTYVKEQYDYVIVDTAPVQAVTDTLLLSNNQVDLYMYVIRANYLDKRMLETPKNLYEEKRLPNMAVLINAVEANKGYGYGYGYGYTYGYGEEEKPWWKKILR
jgi:Mrp family chromosome partitioning ATPase